MNGKQFPYYDLIDNANKGSRAERPDFYWLPAKGFIIPNKEPSGAVEFWSDGIDKNHSEWRLPSSKGLRKIIWN
jgi:hypothetical protein